jgi:hypothetical protein
MRPGGAGKWRKYQPRRRITMRSFIAAPFVVIVGLLGCSSGHPSLPEASKVKTIKVIDAHDRSTSRISPDHFSDVLALFKDGSKDSFPAKWQIMGYDLEITTEDGKQINIWLFKTFKGKGAFAVGRTWEDRVYYRGTTDEQINETMKKAMSAQPETER